MVPTGEEEPEPLKKAVRPSMDVVKEAVGAWSGVMETPASKFLLILTRLIMIFLSTLKAESWRVS